MKYLVCLIAVFSCVACQERPVFENVKGVVSDVREISSDSTQQIGSKPDPIGGAVVGGLVAGKTGAVVGAIAGSSDNSKTVISKRIDACGFTLAADGHKLVFRLTGNWNHESIMVCSLLKDGDHLVVTKMTQGQSISYSWSGDGIDINVAPQLVE